jgi:hypothetical protein
VFLRLKHSPDFPAQRGGIGLPYRSPVIVHPLKLVTHLFLIRSVGGLYENQDRFLANQDRFDAITDEHELCAAALVSKKVAHIQWGF